MSKTIKVKRESCGNEWRIRIEEGWTVHQTPHVGVAIYPPKDGDEGKGLRILRCRLCNKSRQVIII